MGASTEVVPMTNGCRSAMEMSDKVSAETAAAACVALTKGRRRAGTWRAPAESINYEWVPLSQFIAVSIVLEARGSTRLLPVVLRGGVGGAKFTYSSQLAASRASPIHTGPAVLRRRQANNETRSG
jgi:hypothetical protein